MYLTFETTMDPQLLAKQELCQTEVPHTQDPSQYC
jgi:hypothetical protein